MLKSADEALISRNAVGNALLKKFGKKSETTDPATPPKPKLMTLTEFVKSMPKETCVDEWTPGESKPLVLETTTECVRDKSLSSLKRAVRVLSRKGA